jgi:hypothetical protein
MSLQYYKRCGYCGSIFLTPEMIKDIVEKHPDKFKCMNLDDMYRKVINFIKKIQSKYEFYKYFK